jgi:hypothetical protein
MIRGSSVTAEVIELSSYRTSDDVLEVDLITAVDVAIRDLREIMSCWGSPAAYHRAVECEQMLSRVFAEQVPPQQQSGTTPGQSWSDAT